MSVAAGGACDEGGDDVGGGTIYAPARDVVVLTSAASSGSGPEALDGLVGDRGDEVEVLVDMQHSESGKFCGRSDEQIWDRRGAMLAPGIRLSADLSMSQVVVTAKGCHYLGIAQVGSALGEAV